MLNACKDTACANTPIPPGPHSGLLPERLLWAFRRDPLQFLTGLARQYGDIVRLPLGRRTIYLLNHPDFVREVLTTKQAEFIRGVSHQNINSIPLEKNLSAPIESRLRLLEILQPLYEPQILANFGNLIAEQVAQVVKHWRTGQVLDVHSELTDITRRIALLLVSALAAPENLREQALAILQGGQAVMTSALTSSLFLLAQHPEAGDQISAEARGSFSEAIAVGDCNQLLPYTRMVLTETMRLYPPVWIISRQAIRDCSVGGFTIPAGELVFLSPWVMQHDPRFFPQPQRFDPTRWTAEAQTKRPQFSFFPFGAGPRRCLGEDFAWMQGVLILALLLRDWKFELIPGKSVLPYLALSREAKSTPHTVLKVVKNERNYKL